MIKKVYNNLKHRYRNKRINNISNIPLTNVIKILQDVQINILNEPGNPFNITFSLENNDDDSEAVIAVVYYISDVSEEELNIEKKRREQQKEHRYQHYLSLKEEFGELYA